MSQTPGTWHFIQARRLLNEMAEQYSGNPKLTLVEAIAIAQVHATLALAAATAMNGFSEEGSRAIDFDAWGKVVGEEATDG